MSGYPIHCQSEDSLRNQVGGFFGDRSSGTEHLRKDLALSHIAQHRFGFDDIIVVFRFAVLRDRTSFRLGLPDAFIVLRGFL